MRQRPLAHYLANAGATRFISHNDLSPRMLELCESFASDGHYELPFDDYHLVVEVLRDEHTLIDGAHAKLLHESRNVAAFTTCLSEVAAARLWAQFEICYLGATDSGALARADWPQPKMPKVPPWVASFPLHCSDAQYRFVSEFVPTWASAFAIVAASEMKHAVE